MINELNLYFDDKLMYDDLCVKLVFAIDHVAVTLRSIFKQDATEAISDEDAWTIGFEYGANYIGAYVGTDHWLAFLDNYGTGSVMAGAIANPFLAEYIESGYFNKARLSQGMAVIGRPEGAYPTPDYKSGKGDVDPQRVSTGAFEGIDLETLINPRTGKPYFTAKQPKFWLEHGLDRVADMFVLSIQTVLDEFPYQNYLRGGVN
jgi:hypothetical protein